MDTSAKNTYLVCYDVCDSKRLAAVYKTIKGFGDHVQLSVFRCDVTARQLVNLRTALFNTIDAKKDQVLFVDVGPSDGRAAKALSTIGRGMAKPGRRAIVI